MEKLDKIEIINQLSMRYDPRKKSDFYKNNWKSYNNQNSDLEGLTTEKMLINNIKNSLFSSKGRVSISLSSGIDSALCLSLFRKIFPSRKITALTASFEGGDESKKASEIARKYDADFKTIPIESIFKNMPELVMITKKPKWNTYQHIIAKESRKYSKFLITGDGADEIFGGYVFRYNKFLNLTRSNDTTLKKIKNYLECHNRDWVPDQKNLFDKNLNFSWNKIFLYFEKYFSNSLPLLKQVMYADLNGKLYHDFQPNGQRIFSKYDLIGVQPFLNSKIIDFGIKLPIEELYDKKTGLGKLVLRKISKRMAVNHIDEKRGFSLNLLIDWKKNGKDICQEFLLDKNSHIYSEKIINFNWVKKAFNIVENDGNLIYLSRLISILALEVWFRIQFNELKPSQTLV